MSKEKKRAPVKTTSHKRRITLYLSSKSMVDKWKKEAKKSDMSISKFIQNIVNNYFEAGDVLKSQKTLEEQLRETNRKIQQLQQSNIELAKKVKMLDSLTDKYEDDIRKLKNQAFATKYISNGIRTHEKKLVELLREKKNIKEHEILELLHVDPKDVETVRALNNQLERYLDEGIIKMYRGGYQWIE